MNDLINIIALSLLGGVVGLVGGVMFLLIDSWAKKLASYSVPFAAGVLVTVALVGLLPEVLEMVGEDGLPLVLLTFFGAYLFEQFVCNLHHHGCCSTFVPLVIVGDTIHNFIDGVAIGAAYLADSGLGLATAVSSMLHEIPHEIGDFGILLGAGWGKKKVFVLNFVSALFTVVGAVAVWQLTPSDRLIGYLLAVAVGMFLYLGASDFLPHAVEGTDKKKMVLVLLLGVAVMYTVLKVVFH